MIRVCLFAGALLSLVLATSCATGGSGRIPVIVITITQPAIINPEAVYPTQQLSLAATVDGQSNSNVTWSLSGAGTLTPSGATATYVAPATASKGITITVALNSDMSVAGTQPLTVIDIFTQVTPVSANVGSGLTQQFTATAVPEDAPQIFTWTCTPSNAGSCVNFKQDPNISGLAYYTADDSCTASNCVVISASSTLDPAYCSANAKNCSPAKVTPVTSRVSGTYAFRYSGYDSSHHPVAAVGTFVAVSNSISGTEEVLNSGGWSSTTFTGGSYAHSGVQDISNNAGTLILNSSAIPNRFLVVLNGNGDLAMIDADGNGNAGSGIAQESSASSSFKAGTYAFGFTGVDTSGKRVGYAGVLQLNGSATSGTITGGQMDVNDGGSSANGVCAVPPCNVAGTYQSIGANSWSLNLTSPKNMSFDFYEASGSTSKSTPLTFYVISTDPGANPSVSGTMVLQDSSQTYNNAAFNGISVSALTGSGPSGSGTNVSLTLGTTDGSGNFSGFFDQNNAGVILSGATFPPSSGTNNYTYAASGSLGRYTFNMLGNPTASPVVAPIPFVLYASGANRGFLLDQSSSAVITGTMSPQGEGSGEFGGSTMPGPYAAATVNSADSAVIPVAANLLLTYSLTSPNATPTLAVQGTLNPGGSASGTYNMTSLGNNTSATGTGMINLTSPSTQNYAIYVVDSIGCTNTSVLCSALDFFMVDEDSGNTNPSVIFAVQ